MRGAQAPGQRFAQAFLGLFTVLGPLSLGPGPIKALGLGQLARETEPGQMIPTVWFCFLCFLATKWGRVRKVEVVIGSLKPLPTAA